jgi:hypothetical protein
VRRHSGSVCSDLKGRVFLAVPRFAPSAGSAGVPADSRTEDPGFSDVFAGICVPGEAANGELAGVAIECDLERMLQLCTSSATVPGMTVTLVDESGSALVSFTRERGLQKSTTSLPPEPVVAAYLAGLSPSEITTVSRALCAARIPLDSRDRFLGLIVTFPERPSPGR